MCALYKLVKTKNKISYLVSLTPFIEECVCQVTRRRNWNHPDGRTKKITMAFTSDNVAKFIATF